jgi:hypothetical protein
MKRRQLLMLAGGTTISAVVVGTTAPPAQAILPLLLRFLIGQGVRKAIRDRRRKKKKVNKKQSGRRSVLKKVKRPTISRAKRSRERQAG